MNTDSATVVSDVADEARKAWFDMQSWLVMNVGSKEAEDCVNLVLRIVAAEVKIARLVRKEA